MHTTNRTVAVIAATSLGLASVALALTVLLWIGGL